MKTFLIYETDLFGGELNYSYVTKYKIFANSERGAVVKLSKYLGLNFRKQFDGVWYSKSKLTGLVFDDNEYPQYDYTNALEF